MQRCSRIFGGFLELIGSTLECCSVFISETFQALSALAGFELDVLKSDLSIDLQAVFSGP